MLVHLSFRTDFNNDTYCNSGQIHYCDVNDNPSGKARAATLHILDTSTRDRDRVLGPGRVREGVWDIYL